MLQSTALLTTTLETAATQMMLVYGASLLPVVRLPCMSHWEKHSTINSVVMKYSLYAGCVHGDLRLAGSGTSSTRGRVEVCLNNVWGSVCDDHWSSYDARVACRQLGYSDQCKFEAGYYYNKMHG